MSLSARDQEIRALRAAGLTTLELATKFNVSQPRISQLCREPTAADRAREEKRARREADRAVQRMRHQHAEAKAMIAANQRAQDRATAHAAVTSILAELDAMTACEVALAALRDFRDRWVDARAES